MIDLERSRRSLLRAGVGCATLAALGGLSGCVGSIPGLGGGGGNDVPEYTRWVPSRAALGVGSNAWLGSLYLDVADVRASEGALGEETVGRLESRLSELVAVPSAASVDSMVGLASTDVALTYVVEGSFSADEAVDAMPADIPEIGEYEGYGLYPFGRLLVAVGDGVVLVALPDSNDGDPRADVETVIDAERGVAERLSAVNDDVRRVFEAVEDPSSAAAGLPGESDYDDAPNSAALAATGATTSLDGDTARVRLVLVYDDAGAVDAGAIESAATDGDLMRGVADPSVSTDGRTATVSGTVPAADLVVSEFTLGVQGRGVGDATPSVVFDFDYDEPAGILEINHDGGDTLNENNTAALRYGIRGGTMEEWDLPVQAADRVILEREFSTGDVVVVVWEAPGGDRSAVLGEYDVP